MVFADVDQKKVKGEVMDFVHGGAVRLLLFCCGWFVRWSGARRLVRTSIHVCCGWLLTHLARTTYARIC